MKPNVLLICVDHWPGRLLGSAGHKRILTPTLDWLCDTGIHFTEAYTSTPTCIPARRALMTGTTAKTHGDRIFNETLRMRPDLPTMPQVFRDHGYQAYAVGKMHVYPQRDRIGFDEVILCEEGRHHLGMLRDDFELYLQDQGYAGQELTHAMGTNQYVARPWHLPEYCHPTFWTTRNMCRTIQRRDPTRPAFWYCSYIAPHPPLTPPKEYMDMYMHLGVDEPCFGSWADDYGSLPYALKEHKYKKRPPTGPKAIAMARSAFYAQCTYVDHQIRLLIGTLREEGILDDTIVMFVSDHGDMLGDHGLWAKSVMFEGSVRIPAILIPHAGYPRKASGVKDSRLAELRDVMPTLLELCDMQVPAEVEGHSLLGETGRDSIYCEHYEDERSMRMIREKNFKLIYYATGNRRQLFDLEKDPKEMSDLSERREYGEIRRHLEGVMIENLHGTDSDWIENGRLRGSAEKPFVPKPDRGLSAQRGWR